MNDMDDSLLNEARTTILRDAGQSLDVDDEGIATYWPVRTTRQDDEVRLRDEVIRRAHHRTAADVLASVTKYHSAAVMRERARLFRRQFSPDEWLLDIGGGTGWYWEGTTGAQVLLVDFSLEMLRAARMLLRPEDNVLLLHADAVHLPCAASSVAGLWSVQVFQHLPEDQLAAMLVELKRVLRLPWHGEVYNLNPALLHRCLCWVRGTPFHRRGMQGEWLINRLTAREWERALCSIAQDDGGKMHVMGNYSELFFHPNFFVPKRYPVYLEHALANYARPFAACVARQVSLSFHQSPRYGSD